MKPEIHPAYVESTVTCACGNTFKTRSTKPVIRLEICSNCHPFFTGKQKLLDTAGRVERFQKRFEKTGGLTVKKKTAEPRKRTAAKKTKVRILATSTARKSSAAPKKDDKKETKKGK